ncbi:MAG: LppX_LprAFG lipoprotein, partial [Chloroflexota bacterium]
MRYRIRLAALAAVLVTLAVILGACNGNGGEEDTPTPAPSPRTLLAEATEKIASATSFVIEISVSGLPVRIQVADVVLPEEIPLIFEYARGAFVAPDRLQAAIDVRVGDAVARTEVIALGGDQYMRGDLLTQGNWVQEQVIQDFTPEDLLAPDSGIPNALSKVRNLELVERTDLDGLPVNHLRGTIDARDVYSLTFGLMGTREGEMALDIYLLTDG